MVERKREGGREGMVCKGGKRRWGKEHKAERAKEGV